MPMRCRQHVCFHSLVAGLGLLANYLLLSVAGLRCSPPPAQVTIAQTPCDGAQLISNYCASCHSAGRARIDLDGTIDQRAVRRDRAVWKHVLHAVRTGAMPPAKFPQPSMADRQEIIRWIEAQFASLEGDRNRGLVVRRLHRREYVHAVRDLFGIDWQAPADFPADDTGGWDLVDTVPTVPPPLQGRYAVAAAQVLAAVDLHEPTEAWLTSVMRQAFRRPSTSEEANRLHALLDGTPKAGWTAQTLVRLALEQMLTSPHFLYRIETRTAPDRSTDSPTTDVELAGRLAALLWNSVPDEPLLQVAEAGQLRAQLAEQTRRMLHDPRARALAEDFAPGWLQLHRLDGATHLAAPLRELMRQETEHFVAGIVAEDRSVVEFLAADYSYLNEPLAAHYGIAGVQGAALRRVSLAGTGRGGLLTQGSILALTAPTGSASPVQRGKWILDNVLGMPPPAPPAGLLDGFSQPVTDAGPGSSRRVFAAHRAHSSCAHCHEKIDGLGLALADYDGLGVWHPSDDTAPPDPIVLPSGEILHGLAELKGYLQDHREPFLRTLARKLLAFGLGRKLQAADSAAINRIAVQALADPRFGNVVLAVARSAPFQMRAWEP